jgi:hypothetical protein
MVTDIYPHLTIRITDITGKEMHLQKVSHSRFNINVNNYPEGVYIVTLSSGNNEFKQIIIKE